MNIANIIQKLSPESSKNLLVLNRWFQPKLVFVFKMKPDHYFLSNFKTYPAFDSPPIGDYLLPWYHVRRRLAPPFANSICHEYSKDPIHKGWNRQQTLQNCIQSNYQNRTQRFNLIIPQPVADIDRNLTRFDILKNKLTNEIVYRCQQKYLKKDCE